MTRPDVAIVGAGPAGSTAAALLARAGWSVDLIEAREFPREKVCGGFVGAGALEALTMLDLTDAFGAMAGPVVRRIGLYAGRHAAHRDCGPLGRAVPRARFDSLLRERAIALGARPVSRRARDIADLGARLTIVAHGNPPLRGIAGSDLIAFSTTRRGLRLPRDTMPLIGFPGGYGGIVAAAGDRFSLSFCVRKDVLAMLRSASPRPDAGDAMLAHAAAHCEPLRHALAFAESPSRWLAATVRPGWRSPRSDGAFAMGNAAAEAHPAIADGIGMAMESAVLLSRTLLACPDCLASPPLRAKIARHHARQLRARLGLRLAASRLYARVVMDPGLAPVSARALSALPLLLGAAARIGGGKASFADHRQ